MAYMKALSAGLLISCAASAADSAVRYEFTTLSPYDVSSYSPLGSVSNSFSFTADAFIQLGAPDAIFVDAGELDQCESTSSTGAAECSYVLFQRSYTVDPELFFNQVQFTVATTDNVTVVNAYFEDGAFTASGTYLSLGSFEGPAARLTVTDLGYTAVPEPATWAMMIGGFGVLGAAARRRSRSQTACA